MRHAATYSPPPLPPLHQCAHNVCRDLTIPPVGTATGAHVAVAGLREAVSRLEVPTPGEACAIRCGRPLGQLVFVGAGCRWGLPVVRQGVQPDAPHTWPLLTPCNRRSVARPAPLLLGGLLETAVRDELTTQNLGAAPRFVMVRPLPAMDCCALRLAWGVRTQHGLRCGWVPAAQRRV